MSGQRPSAQEALMGVTVTPATPFTPQGALDLEGAAANARVLAAAGIRSVAVAGNTGEFHALAEEEVDRLTAVWRDGLGEGVFLWVGAGGALADLPRRLEAARRQGADGILLHSPPHTYLSPGGVARYLEAVLDAAQAQGLAVALYKRDARIPDAALIAVRRHPALAGVKYAVNDLMAVSRLVEAVGEALPVACGTAEVWAAAFASVGARGFTSGLAGVAPRLSLELQEAIARGDLAAARRVVALVAPFERMRQEGASALNVPVVKAAMARRGLAAGPVRPPLEDLDAAHRQELDAILSRWEEAGAWR